MSVTDASARSPWQWSIRWRLPIWICGLVLASVAGFGWTAYRQVQAALIEVAATRLQTVSRELISLLAVSAEQRLTEARRLAARPAVRAWLEQPDAPRLDAVRRDFETFLKSSPQTLGIEVWSGAGQRVLDLPQTATVPPSRAQAPTAAAFGPIVTHGDRGYYELVVPLGGRSAAAAAVTPGAQPAPASLPPTAPGFFVIRRQASTAGAADALRNLLGGGISLRVGSATGIWTDLSSLTAPPPIADRTNEVTEYRDTDGEVYLGTGTQVKGTPWEVWLAIPRALALAPAELYLQRIVPFGLLAVVLGSVIAWFAARRITKPLNDLTAAAESIAGGDPAGAVKVAVKGRDEIGRLGNAFNAMTRHVKDGYERLDARVAERTRDLEHAMAQLEETQEELVRREKLAMLGQLASGVGHELRNPLGVMTNAIYFLEMVQPDAPPEVKEYLALVRSQIGLSERIVNDLLDYARIKPPRREALPLARLADAQLARLPVVDGIRVQYEIPSDLPSVDVDPVQMGQVLFNLLVNAVQAMESTGGVLTVRGRVDGDKASLTVSDTGPGVPAAIQHKIFDALFTTKARGIGLGLAVSRSLAESNGGTLTLISNPGEGATFTVTMPVVRVLETVR